MQTAYTTLWILWLLSKNDEVVQNIRSKDDTYVKCVVKEAMRMYPVAPFLTRILTQDTILGKYKLNKGVRIKITVIFIIRQKNGYALLCTKFTWKFIRKKKNINMNNLRNRTSFEN